MIERLMPLLLSFLSRDFGVKMRRARRNGLLYVVVALLALTALGAGVAAATVLLANAVGTAAALAGLALSAMVLALAVLATVLAINRSDRTVARTSPVGDVLLAVTAASVLPMVLRSRVLIGAATLGTIAFLASRRTTGDDDHPSSAV